MDPNTVLEINRINELVQLEILDTPKEQEFDDIVELASALCNTPISLISLIDGNRQWFKAKKGLDITETDRSASFCAHALDLNDLLVINDATKDERFITNPLVTSDPHIRFYAGAPIVSPGGYKLGTLCIIDRKPKELSWQQASTLKMLSLQVGKLIELHYKKIQLNVLEEELTLQKLKAARIQQQTQHLTNLCQLENAAVQRFITSTLTPLKSGKFTKKDLAQIYQSSQQQSLQITHFNEALSTVTSLQQGQAQHTSSFSVWELVNEIAKQQADSIKEHSNKLVTYVPQSLTLQQYYSPLQLMLKVILQAIVSTIKKKEIQLVAMEQHNGVEIRFSLINADLRDSLAYYFNYDSSTLPRNTEQKLLPVELALIKELAFQLKGRVEWNQLGDEGTAIVLSLPNLPT